MIEPGLHLSVGETHRLIAQARRLRSEYLHESGRQLVAWVMRRWRRTDADRTERPGDGHVRIPQTPPRPDVLRKAA
jgi:hypothetical protein